MVACCCCRSPVSTSGGVESRPCFVLRFGWHGLVRVTARVSMITSHCVAGGLLQCNSGVRRSGLEHFGVARVCATGVPSRAYAVYLYGVEWYSRRRGRVRGSGLDRSHVSELQ